MLTFNPIQSNPQPNAGHPDQIPLRIRLARLARLIRLIRLIRLFISTPTKPTTHLYDLPNF